MSWADDLASFVDYRIQLFIAALARPTAMGTVVTAAAGSIYCDVIFDGSTASVPVKTFANVRPRAGDRVGIIKYGSEWVVTGTFGNSAWPNEVTTNAYFSGSNTTSSTTYVDMPGPVQVTYNKRFDETNTRIMIAVDTYVSIASTNAVHSVSWNGTYAAEDDFHVGILHNEAQEHLNAAGWWVKGTKLAKGTYTVTLGWRRASGDGGGNVTVDGSSPYSLTVTEIAP